ncbi:MAG: tRNA threonylcarbamoyladenosine dehydratase [Lentisphaerae bacterium]|nr:tRNA threonylcarbamoyladenosine dehydratase [Lentisphaerota bacterium]MCP4102132.1 tRNA threonylcarbamoyladenosine dehydratase [Lentisphaerota bacterium]
MPRIENVPQWQQRTAMLLKRDGLEKLKKSRVLVVGLGGVGAYAAELICRAGVGKMTIVDSDAVEASNRNRQLSALSSTDGQSKALLMAERLRDINPESEITPLELFLRDELTDEVLKAHQYDYVVDAIDTLSPKVNLVSKCVEMQYPLVSSMGAGGKTDPTQVRIADISKSYNCPLAKAIRKRLHRRGIRKGFKAVFSPEDVPQHAVYAFDESETGKCGSVVGTISYMPPIFGCCCASVVLRDLTGLLGC